MNFDCEKFNSLQKNITWKKTTFCYIPRPLLEKFETIDFFNDPLESMQILLYNSSNELRMYGTAQELMENLRIYRNFSFSHKKDGACDEQCLEPVKFRSLKGEYYINKQDIHFSVYYTVVGKYVEKEDNLSKIIDFLLNQRKRIAGCFEFVRYDKEFLVRLHGELAKLMPDDENQLERDLGILQNFFSTHHDTFFPYAQTKNENIPFMVRVFEDGPEKFVLTSEIFTMNKVRNSYAVSDYDENRGIWCTIDLDDLLETHGNELNHVEFIRCPIIRAKHAAVPILSPKGEQCILIADALLEMFRRLISVINIFQKMKNDEWDVVTEYFLIFEVAFEADKYNYFTKLAQVNEMKERFDTFWEKWENVPVKSVRHIGKNGFKVDDLKDELKYLGITNALPEIINHAEAAYVQVDKMKKEEVLRTCDMFDALEHCQLICIFHRFPNMTVFLHSQKACHRIPNLHCELCSEQCAQKQFRETKWKEYADSEVKLASTYMEERPEAKCRLNCSDGKVLGSNYVFFTDKQIQENNIKYFILDKEDASWTVDSKFSLGLGRHFDGRKFLMSLKNFSIAKNYDKKVYLRAIPSAGVRVFTEDVLEIIPIVLKQQNSQIDDDRLEKYRKKWKCKDQGKFNTIDMEELKRTFEEFGINKSLITIVPDPVYKLKMHEMSEKPTISCVSFFSPNGKMVMDNAHAIFYVFESVICGINWNMDYCKTHPNCIKDLKKNVIAVIETFFEISKNFYVLREHVEELIKILKEHCTYKQWMKTEKVDYELSSLDPNSDFYVNDYYIGVNKCGLDMYGFRAGSYIPVWIVRMFYMIGWVERFFDEDSLEIQHTVKNLIACKIPMKIAVKEIDLIQNFLIVGPTVIDTQRSLDLSKMTKSELDELIQKMIRGRSEKEMEHPNVQMIRKMRDALHSKEMAQMKVMEKKSNVKRTADKKEQLKESDPVDLPAENPTQNLEEVDDTEPENIKNDSEKATDSIPKKKDTPPIQLNEMTSNESKCCSKCFRTSERCNEAKKELKTTQNKLKMFEKKAKRTDELEKKMKEMTKEMEKLKKNNTQLATENEDLKLKNSKKNEVEEKLKLKLNTAETMVKTMEKECEKYKKNEESQRKEAENMKKMIRTLEEKENIMKEAAEIEQINNSIKQSSLENWVLEKERIIEDLRQTNTRLSFDNGEQRKTIQRLLDQSSSTLATSSTRAEVDISGGYRFQLVTLQKIKDTIRSGTALKHAKKMVEKLSSLTNRPEIHHLATYELSQFEGKNRNYLQAVERNIQKLKQTRNVTDLPPLPDHPSLSDRFMKEYWNEIDKQRSTSSESTSELADTECLICLINMESDDVTIKCDNCRRRFHSTCASEWFKVKRVCPACSGGLLDPAEFPSLG